LEIGIYIKELLLLKGQLCFAPLGQFILKQTPATINVQRNQITPPGTEVQFIFETTDDSSELINYIVSKTSLSQEEVVAKVSEITKQITHSLEQGTQVTVEGLGTFSTTGFGEKIFKPGSNSKFDLGFETLSISLPVEKPQPVVPTSTPITQQSGPAIPVRNKRSKVGLWVALAIILLVLTSGFLIYILGFWPSIRNTTINFLHKKSENITIVADTTKINKEDTSAIARTISTQTNPQNALAITQKNDTSNAEVQIGRYCIIAGSFKDAEKASTLQKKFENAGYTSSLLNYDGYIRVSIAAYNNKQAALRDLMKIRNEKGSEDFWLLTLKQ
jgi:hypothetical protein